MLGQKSATMTLDLYGHLFPDQLDQVADRLDAAARAVVYPSQHHPDIGGLEETENPPARQAIFRSSPDGIRTRATALRGRSGHRWLCMIGAESCSLKEICARASVGAERPFAAAMCTPCVPLVYPPTSRQRCGPSPTPRQDQQSSQIECHIVMQQTHPPDHDSVQS